VEKCRDLRGGVLLGLDSSAHSDNDTGHLGNLLGLLPVTHNATTLAGFSLAGSELRLAGRAREQLGGKLKVPGPEDLNLDDIEEQEVDKGDTKNREAPAVTDRGNPLAATKDTVDREEQGNDLGTDDAGGEDPRGQILPAIAGNTGGEDDKVRSRRDVKIHDCVKLVLANVEHIASDKEVSERERSQADSQQE